MTTTVKVHVNGKYRASVIQDDREPVTVEGNYNGGSGERAFYLWHPAKGTFIVTEEQVADDGRERTRPNDPNLPRRSQAGQGDHPMTVFIRAKLSERPHG